EAWGMIWKCVDDDKLREETDALAAKFASAPTKGLATTKKLLREGATRTLTEQLDVERDAQRMLGRTGDYKEGVASFMEKRQPKFTGN
ncbi:MAG: enoyl-CoA hydratase-related protein, partial [Terricaulis sp.]